MMSEFLSSSVNSELLLFSTKADDLSPWTFHWLIIKDSYRFMLQCNYWICCCFYTEWKCILSTMGYMPRIVRDWEGNEMKSGKIFRSSLAVLWGLSSCAMSWGLRREVLWVLVWWSSPFSSTVCWSLCPGWRCLCSVFSSVLVVWCGDTAQCSVFQCSCKGRNVFFFKVYVVVEVVHVEGWVMGQVYIGSEGTISWHAGTDS